ncbi:type I restriction endonuclease subunit R [Carboxydothermus pertinax]|uniref:Type I restriction enzyme endonuclease subunit n=1 Tax=Carboxydothermus pertinax TaxID=870242 RepID=A0A1L8CSE2_9THEO|nr:type I restriction endonuclease subunit R [Carboxydothermus pertinax]GAV21855.1 DEAD/DEAH box helicase [Carboxydothermus pertinax]
MNLNQNFESVVEEAAINWFCDIGYEYLPGSEIPVEDREDFREVILKNRLYNALIKINPGLPLSCIEDAIRQLKNFQYPRIELNNREIHKIYRNGAIVTRRRSDGEEVGEIVKIFDYENPENNDFLVCNQVKIKGTGVRIPDIVVYINGLPVGVFELKNPLDETATIEGAYRQLELYKRDIPDLFAYNEICAVSDGTEAKAGTLTASWERFAAWKSIDGVQKIEGMPALEVLIKGMFAKNRVLDLIRNFITFTMAKDEVVKIMAMYHQYYGVNRAVEETIRAVSPTGDRRIGTFWHTQGSGKSLSMVFYTGKIIELKELQNPTVVVITDRNDLDDQLYNTFCSASDLIPYPKQIESVEDLKEKLSQVAAGGIFFTTIQKFQAETDESLEIRDPKLKRSINKGKTYPLLSDRSNIIVIVDEAHRSHYEFIDGFARNIRQAFPNASFIGFTGTPIDFEDKSTLQVFGDYISIYDMKQAVEDKAIVPIYYEGRLVKLHLINEDIDREFEEVTEGEEEEVKNKLKTKWAALEALVGTQERLETIAKDIVEYFEERCKVLEGKGMIVCMSRRICVDLYNEIIKLRPHWHSDDLDKGVIKIVMSGNASKDPKEFLPHLYTKSQIKEIEKRMKDPNDPLKLVIVRDMWLTGFDVPCLHTMYIDKPMKGHNLMQAIARVNRVFRDKPAGLVVDYIGIADDLKRALANYTRSTGKEAATLPIDEAIRIMQEKYDIVCSYFHGIDFSDWEEKSAGDKLYLLKQAMELINKDETTKKDFLEQCMALSKAFALVVPRKEAMHIRSEVAFFQAVRSNVVKYTPPKGLSIEELDSAVKQIISKGVAASDKPIDIFDAAGLKKPDLSILSEEFLDELMGYENKNLQIEVLRKLLNDEIRAKSRKNQVKYSSFKEMIEKVLNQYHNRAITSAEVIKHLIDLAREMRHMDQRAKEMDLTEEEIAFYDIVSQGREAILKDEDAKEIAREVVRIIKSKTEGQVDWTIKENIKASIRATVKRLLRRKGFKDQEELDNVVKLIIEQAVYLFEDAA